MTRKPKVADLGAQPCRECGGRLRHLEGCPLIAHETLREAIAAELARIGRGDANAAHVEAWVRVEHPERAVRLKGWAFEDAVLFALSCADARSEAENEGLREAVEDRAQRQAEWAFKERARRAIGGGAC